MNFLQEYKLGLNKFLASSIVKLYKQMFFSKKRLYNRGLAFGDYFVDRWEKAKMLGFGEGTSVYDNVLVLGDVKVGKNTWIGSNVVLDGSGGLEIGSNCSISIGVQIYSHDSVQWAVTGGGGGSTPYEYSKTTIGDNCFIGPNTVIQRGVSIGSGSIIGAMSFVNKDIPPNSKAFGSPAKIISTDKK